MTNPSPQPAGKRPNIMIVVMDDMGFSDPGCYGGEIDTPNLNELAERGVRFARFYNAGRCWPSRSCILTGYFAPQVSMDPPDLEHRPPWQRMIPEYLGEAGYRTYHSGKWHIFNTPEPEDGGGFDRSWGYDIEQFHHFFDEGDETKFSSTAITDHALSCLDQHQAGHADKPFFHYLCYTAPHFPVQAEPADIDKYRDKYNEGWDIIRRRRWQRLKEMGIVNCDLSEREPEIPAPHYLEHKEEWDEAFGPGEIEYAVAWDDLSDEQKAFQATKMAIHAAMVDRTDRELGRVIDHLKETGEFDNTLILFLSDNGASAEIMIRGLGHDADAPAGSKMTHLCLGPGWSNASNSPFRRHKIWVHEGGIATPLIACWPDGISDPGSLRFDQGHCIDFLPTCLELAGIPPDKIPLPERAPPLPGKSLVPTLEQDGSVERDHLYFHHEGNRALIAGDWKLVNEGLTHQGETDDPWALYNLAEDRCEMVNLAGERPEKLAEMRDKWHACEDRYRRVVDDG